MPIAQGKIQIRRRPKDGEPGSDGKNAVYVRADPPVVYLRPGDVTKQEIYLYLYDGDTQVDPDAWHTLIPGSTGGTDAETNLYWQFRSKSGDKPCGYTVAARGAGLAKEFTANPYVEYKGKKYYFTVTFKLLKDGEQGKQGLQGCIYRFTEWGKGFEYRNDLNLVSEGVRYIDFAGIRNSTSPTGWDVYQCLSTHSPSSDANKPKSQTATQYWKPLSSLAPIYTPFIMADGALLRFLQSNRILVMSDDGQTVNVSMGGGDYPLWVGAPDPENAPSKIAKDGTFYTRKAVIEGDVVFAGKVLPMETRITSANYKNYRYLEGIYDGIPDYLLDFAALTGRVILDKSFGSVPDSECAKAFRIWDKYPSVDKEDPELWRYIGSTLLVRNEMTVSAGITGYLSNKDDLSSANSYTISAGDEILLECRLRLVNGKRVIGWYIIYNGPAGKTS